jgi:N-acetylmuramoyl-L-alanine amidase
LTFWSVLRPARLLLAGALAALSMAVAVAADSRRVEGVRVHEGPDYTRVVFDVSGPVQYQLFTLDNPNRVVIDVRNARADSGFDPNVQVSGTARVRAVRVAPRGADYRVVLEVASQLRPESFALDPVPPYGHRLVVDLHGAGGPSRAAPKPAPRSDDRDVVIAIDPGHGGEDPGALGPDRIREKDVVLNISRRLAKHINAMPGYRAVLVRDGDYYVALRDRVRFARDQRADLFVSVHADAFKSPHPAGASVYTLSDRGASSETARWLAEKENRSDLIGGVGDVSLGDKDDMLAHVLLDLSMDANRSASIELGARVLGQLASVTSLHKNRVEQAGFVVLKAPDIPSILVETGYISNPAEARRLNTADYQERLARALASAIGAHMEHHAPPGTLVAARRDQGGPRRHTITNGDTLSQIAARYGTTARRLREANGLNSDVIRIGQTLVIPAS